MIPGQGKINYFSYSSNLNKKQMLERCPEARPLNTAVLPNYKLIFTGWSRQWRGATATIQIMRGDRVRGAVYQITEDCLRRLDRFEGYPQTAERINVNVFDEDSEAIPAVTYLKKGQLQEGQPSKEYLAVIQQGLRDWRLF